MTVNPFMSKRESDFRIRHSNLDTKILDEQWIIQKKIRANQKKLLDIKKSESDPNFKEKKNQYQRERYKKTSKRQIETSTIWNKTHRDQVNATRKLYHEKNKDKINEKLRKKRWNITNPQNGKMEIKF